VRHWRAKHLLAALPDGTLPPATARAVRAHAAGCGRCERRLAEHARAEQLLRRIPASILPLERSPLTYPRLSGLARWSGEPDLPAPDRWRLPVLGFVGALAALSMIVAVGSWSPVMAEPRSPVTLAYVPQDSAAVPPALRPGP
jgi:anti-sigma factor RsiW